MEVSVIVRRHRDPLTPESYTEQRVAWVPGGGVALAAQAGVVSPMATIYRRGERVEFEDVILPGDVLDVYEAPEFAAVLGPILSQVIGSLISALAGLLLQALFGQDQKKPAELKERKPSAVYTVAGVQNETKTNEPVQVLFGEVNLTPPFVAQPYVRYIGSEQYFYCLLCLTQGYCDVSNVMMASAEDKEIDDAYFDFRIFSPDMHRSQFGHIQASTTIAWDSNFWEDVFTSEQVTDIVVAKRVDDYLETQSLSQEVGSFDTSSQLTLYNYRSGMDGMFPGAAIEFQNTAKNNFRVTIASISQTPNGARWDNLIVRTRPFTQGGNAPDEDGNTTTSPQPSLDPTEPEVNWSNNPSVKYTLEQRGRSVQFTVDKAEFASKVSPQRNWGQIKGRFESSGTHNIMGRVIRSIEGDTTITILVAPNNSWNWPNSNPDEPITGNARFYFTKTPLVLNRIQANLGRIAGPFAAQAKDMQISRVELDIEFPRGLIATHVTEGKYKPASVMIRFLFEEVDKFDRPTGLKFYYFPGYSAVVYRFGDYWQDTDEEGEAGEFDPQYWVLGNVDDGLKRGTERKGYKGPETNWSVGLCAPDFITDGDSYRVITGFQTTPLRLTFHVNIRAELLFHQPPFDPSDPHKEWDATTVLTAPRVTNSTTNRWRVSAEQWRAAPTNRQKMPKDDDGPMIEKGDMKWDDELRWIGLKGISNGRRADGTPYGSIYGHTSLMAFRVKATSGMSQEASSRIRALVKRTIPTISSYGSQPAYDDLPRVRTRNPVDAAADILVNPHYGGGLPLSMIDHASGSTGREIWGYCDNPLAIPAVNPDYSTRRKINFDAAFESEGTILDAIKATTAIFAGSAVPMGSVYGFIRNRTRDLNQYLFTDFHIAAGTLRLGWQLEDEADITGFEVEYRDRRTFQPKFVTGQADRSRLARHTLVGCTDRLLALDYSKYLWARRRFLRRTVEFESSLDGHLPTPGDRIAVQSSMADYGRSMRVAEVVGDWFWLEHDAPLGGMATQIVLRSLDGVPSAVVTLSDAVSPIVRKSPMGRERAYAVAPFAQSIVGNHPSFDNTVCVVLANMMKSFIVTRVTPIDEWRARVEGVNYDYRIYNLPGQ